MVAIQIDDRVLDSGELYRCTLCGTWLPDDELLTIARSMRARLWTVRDR